MIEPATDAAAKPGKSCCSDGTKRPLVPDASGRSIEKGKAMDMERLERVRKLSHDLVGEIEAIVIGTRNADFTMHVITTARPQPNSLNLYREMVDQLCAAIRAANPSYVGHQEDQLEAAGLVNHVIAMALAMQPPIVIATKFKRFDVLFQRARADEWVPKLEDQLRGARPIVEAARN
jgi:hypothetical protein